MIRTPHNLRRRSTRRRGTSLIEGLIASVLLATSVVGISGVLASSYQNQTHARLRREASLTGRKVMETITALPMDPAVSGQAALANYQPATTTTTTTTSGGGLLGGLLGNVNVLGINVSSSTTSTTTTTSSGATQTIGVNVDRRATLNGTASATGDFAIVTVDVPAGDAQAALRLRRLVTSVEAAGNLTP